jgi:hypothetical protein
MGVEKWGLVSTNVMAMTNLKERVLPNLGWTYEARKGRGGGARFIQTGSGVLKLAIYRPPQSRNYGQSPKEYQGNDCNSDHE